MRVPGLGAVWMMAVASLAANSETVPLPFRLFGHGAIVVPVSVDGGAPRPFLVDTGASRSIVTHGLVQRLGLLPGSAEAVTLSTALGTRTVTTVQLDAAALGTQRPVDLAALVVPDRELDWRAPVDGVIGQDVLAARAFVIDYRRRTLSWLDPHAAPAGGARLALTFWHGTPVVTLPQSSVSGRSLRLVPDTGATAVVLFAGRGRPLPDFTPRDSVWVHTLAGDRLAQRVLLDALDVGDVHLREPSTLLLEASGSAADPTDGLLPLHLFSRATFNGPAGYLIVER